MELTVENCYDLKMARHIKIPSSKICKRGDEQQQRQSKWQPKRQR